MLFFKNYEIPFVPSIDKYIELFENVFKFYNRMLRDSIKVAGFSYSNHLLFYIYLICDAKELSNIILYPWIKKFQLMSILFDLRRNIRTLPSSE